MYSIARLSTFVRIRAELNWRSKQNQSYKYHFAKYLFIWISVIHIRVVCDFTFHFHFSCVWMRTCMYLADMKIAKFETKIFKWISMQPQHTTPIANYFWAHHCESLMLFEETQRKKERHKMWSLCYASLLSCHHTKAHFLAECNYSKMFSRRKFWSWIHYATRNCNWIIKKAKRNQRKKNSTTKTTTTTTHRLNWI